ncbi:FAD dependent oxidoreductase [Mucor mucedo]|uniref:FAD dependent oxidoreductase n=1 Tax=Mucor mucedo TaxID=29922 RepID=UPI00221E7F39|nr:FAD dependent oxidoreductase [Mucor mucedo]KAI7894534.1 FAD dependent oxidoreductase [Mucor mucedo]
MYEPPKPGSKIIIVGAGCFGLATALALSSDKEKNYDIHVFDRGVIPIIDAASTDISKAVRMDYGTNKLCMELAVDAIRVWEQWNKERADNGLKPVYHNTGMIAFSDNGELSEYDKQGLETIREAGYGEFIEELSSEEIKKRYPFFETAVNNGYDIAYFNKVGGWCNSSEAIMHIYKKCISNGVNFILGKESGCFESNLVDPQSPRTVLGIKTIDGNEHRGDRVILATGPWTPGVIDMQGQVIASGQVIVQFKLSDKDRKSLNDLPVWSGNVSKTGCYGFPVNDDGILKIGKHSIGYLNPRATDNISIPRTQASNSGDTIPLKALNEFREFLDTFLPLTTPLDVFYSRVCWYSDSIDGDFVICPHPKYDNYIVATGDSGHAMKFLPNIGQKIKDVIDAKDTEYTRAWAWRNKEAKPDFYDRPLLIQNNHKLLRMATLEELKAKINC